MKLTLAYIPEEETAAVTIAADFQRKHPGAKVRKSDRHPPFRHIYMTTKNPAIPRHFKENTCTIPPDMV